MALPLLAAALIVRDEAARLPGCLAALRALGPLIDHVVVHDTGSTDETVRIAREAGAVVVEGAWAGDFALARNVALEHARATWVLAVDADERVVADPDRLRELLEQATGVPGQDGAPDAGVVQLVNVGADEGEQYAAPILRLVRPDRVRFAGRLHERPVRLDDTAAPPRLLDVPREALLLRHFGYADPATVQRKAERNLELADVQLAEALATEPADHAPVVRALYHRGRTLLSAGRLPDALVDLEHLRALRVPVAERLWGLDVLAQLYLALGRREGFGELVAELADLGADERYCAWLTAGDLLTQDRFSEALPLLRTVDRLIDTVGRELDIAQVVEAQLITAGRVGEVDEAAACCIRMMAGLGRADGLGPLLLTLWGERPAEWLAELLRGADKGHLDAVAAELRRCEEPGPQLAEALAVAP